MTDHRQTIVVGLSDSVPEVLALLRRSQQIEVALDIPSASPLFLTANEFRALQALAELRQITLYITSEDPLRQQLATLFKLNIAPAINIRSEMEGDQPLLGPEVPPGPDNDSDEALSETDPEQTSKVVNEVETQSNPASISAESTPNPIHGSHRFQPVIGRARASTMRQRLVTVGAVLIALLLAYLAAFQFLTEATIILTLKRQPVERTLSIRIVEPGGTSTDSTPSIVANPVTFPVSTSRSAPATGVQTIGDTAARGVVTLSNPTDEAVKIAAGTQFSERIDGITYQFLTAVEVPAANDNGPGFGQADVVCLQPGAVGNRDIGFLSGSLENGLYYANRDEAITGGIDRQSSIVSQADLDALEAAALNDLVALASTHKAGPDLVILTPSIEIGQPTLTSDVAVGQEATTITVQASGQVSALTYNATELTATARNALTADAPVGYEIDPAATQLADPSLSTATDGTTTLSIRAIGSAIPKITQERWDEIAKGIAGKNTSDARDFVESQPDVQSFVITYSPGWLPRRIPADTGRVSIETR